MKRNDRTIDRIRRHRTEAENQLIEELMQGRIGRRDFLRHGSVLGMSLPLLASIGGAVGLSLTGPAPALAKKTGGTLKIATVVETGSIDPLTVADECGLLMLQQTGEFLCISDSKLQLQPVLAESWKPNQDGTVWRFALRKGVKFHNGKTMDAGDVVATFNRLADPHNASNALSAFAGVLSPGGTRKVDDHTVEFHLDVPIGNFPYYVSSDNYNAIILPADYAGDFEKTFIGTGPFRLEKFTPRYGASFVRNPDYWGPAPYLDRTEFTFYADIAPQILALQSRAVHVVNQITVVQGIALIDNPEINVLSIHGSSHTQVHMRNDVAPFTDKRVRRAVALCLDRQKLVKGLFRGRADLGNDSPFAPAFPSTDTAVPQRERNIAEAKELLSAAGLPNGFSTTLTSEKFNEIPEYCQIIQQSLRAAGITVKLNIESQDAYYGKAQFGQSDWLDSPFAATDYGHRGVPNVLLAAPLKSGGTWNSSRFANKEYDALVGQYIAALDLQSQREVAGRIQRLLLDETPIIFSYFSNYLTATTRNVGGVEPAAAGALFLGKAWLD
jgi:peptide/nickel transport system substrate-binding protein